MEIDVCTGFPEGTWAACCAAHDAAYAAPDVSKLNADWGLAQCVAEQVGWPLAIIMFLGVTALGLGFWVLARWRR